MSKHDPGKTIAYELAKAHLAGDAEAIRKANQRLSLFTKQIINALDGSVHPIDYPILVSVLEQYTALKRTDFNESNNMLADYVKHAAQLQKIEIRFPFIGNADNNTDFDSNKSEEEP